MSISSAATPYGGAGKSEVANILERDHGFIRPHIGRPLKNMLRSLLIDFGMDQRSIDRYVDGDLKREIVPCLGVTSTSAQQTLGTQWGRQCVRDDLWLDNWLRRVDNALSAGGRVAQESVRFENEAAAIRARGGIIVRVHRPGGGGEFLYLRGIADFLRQIGAKVAEILSPQQKTRPA